MRMIFCSMKRGHTQCFLAQFIVSQLQVTVYWQRFDGAFFTPSNKTLNK